MIGDAAGFTSPLFEGGSHLALWSGREAAHTISAAITQDDISDAMMQPYVKSWKKTFPPYHKILKGKTSLYELSDQELSNMAHCLPEELGKMSVRDKVWIGMKILVRHPFLYTKGVVSVLLSFGYSRAKYFGW